MDKSLAQLEKNIGYHFTDQSLLVNALTHRSYVNESRARGVASVDNERLEFFGDAIIEFYISEYLYRKYPDLPEGELTKIRAAMVCEPSLAACAAVFHLGDFLFMGKGEEQSGGRERASITSDAFEALTAAIYLDGGAEKAHRHIDRFLIASLEDKDLFFDAKTHLQEMIQKKGNASLSYELTAEEGPSHDRTFEMVALVNGKEIGRGRGHSKKAAQQQAALSAISHLKK